MKNITVIGAGTMGNGIAQVFAMNGFNVVLFDIQEVAIQKALNSINTNLSRLAAKNMLDPNKIQDILSNIESTTSLEKAAAVAELIVEAATENLEIKLKLFQDLDKVAQPDCILATNTSSISITKIASVTKRQDKVIGMHFMNPVPIMKLVEIIRGYNTSDSVCKTIVEITNQLNKIPVEVNDYPGFVANRILMPMINEAIYTLYEGVAGVEEIDAVMQLGMAHPMGPLALADFIGLDVCHAILKIMHEGLGNQKYAPCPLLSNMVLAGKLGKKTNEGFYIYQEGVKEKMVSSKFRE